MGAQKMKMLVALLTFVTACLGARNTGLMGQPTTTTTQPPVSVMLATRPQPSTISLDLPSPPPAQCHEATDSMSPLGRLRAAMKSTSYTQLNSVFDAYIVFYSDEHLSEEPAPEERRLEYISGWDGVGTAAVLADGGAAIWVPSGDMRRAKATVSCAWAVFDADDLNQRTVADWIVDRLGRPGRVGADSRLTSVNEWQLISTSLARASLTLIHTESVLDQIWAEEPDPARRRPEFSKIVANLHNMDYTGLTWRDKVTLLRQELIQLGADAMVVTALDEVAWLLNVRGRDVPHAPLLKAFVIVSLRDVRVFAPQGKLSMPIREALGVYSCFSAPNCTKIKGYNEVYSDLRRATERKILIPVAGTFQRGASFAIGESVPINRRMFQNSPIIYLKAQKNEAEIKGMHKAHLRDAVAMCTLFSYLEGMVKTGLTETSVAMKVDLTRATQASYVGVSMATKVAFGPSGAEPDYQPTPLTNRRVYTNSTMIIHSGGQYDEGTTVVTRTVHFGTPTPAIRTAYTTVLRSLAAMATLQIPVALPAAHTDPVVRAPLWAAKQDYPHPTGHGVGAALNPREDPVVLDYRQDTNLHTFREGYFITVEPAWYERSKYGVRLGNVLELVPKTDGYLGLNETTLVPFEPKLIDKSLLTEYELSWINAYNDRIRKVVGPELQAQGLMDVYYWMTNKTAKVEHDRPRSQSNGGPKATASWGILVFVLIASSVPAVDHLTGTAY